MSNPTLSLGETNAAIYARLKSGDANARDELIENNIAFVHSKANLFLRERPYLLYLRDDLVSEGLIELTNAVDTMQANGVSDATNPTAYIGVALRAAFSRCADNEQSLAPDRSQRRARQNGTMLDAPRHVPMPEQRMPDDADGESIDSGKTQMSRTEPAAPDYTAVFELREVIESCCETANEKTIIRLREEGYTDREIGDAVGMIPQTVSDTRAAIYARFLEKTGMGK